MRQLGWVKERQGGTSDPEGAYLGAFEGLRTPSVLLPTLGKDGPRKEDSQPCQGESKTQMQKMGTQDICAKVHLHLCF